MYRDKRYRQAGNSTLCFTIINWLILSKSLQRVRFKLRNCTPLSENLWGQKQWLSYQFLMISSTLVLCALGWLLHSQIQAAGICKNHQNSLKQTKRTFAVNCHGTVNQSRGAHLPVSGFVWQCQAKVFATPIFLICFKDNKTKVTVHEYVPTVCTSVMGSLSIFFSWKSSLKI